MWRFFVWVLSNYPLKKCAQMANAVGALTVQVMGGSNGVQSLDK
jgi:sugar/nucleoside kinase (ribokinase family)